MNDTLAHPLVRSYLSSVEELTAALPGDRRQELLADLREHIEVALADAGTSEESTVRQVLGRLGAPGEIAAAALAEEADSPPQPESSGRTSITLGLVVLALPAVLVPGIGPLLAPVAAVAALVRLWNSGQWSRSEKRQATLLTLSPVVTAPAFAAVLALALGGLTPSALLGALLLAVCLPALAAVRLGRSAARLRRRVA